MVKTVSCFCRQCQTNEQMLIILKYCLTNNEAKWNKHHHNNGDEWTVMNVVKTVVLELVV